MNAVPVPVHRFGPSAGRNDRLYFTFVTEGVISLVAQAVEVAGEQAVLVIGGADLTRQLA